MKNLLNNLLNWVLKKGPSETKKDQVWEEKEQAWEEKDQVKRTKLSEKEQAGSKKEQAGSKKDQVKGTKLVQKRTKLEMGSEAREVMGSEVMSVRGSEAREVMGSEAMSANHALITQLSRTNHPISLRAIRYAAVLFMVLMVGVGNVWGADRGIWTDDGAYVGFRIDGSSTSWDCNNLDDGGVSDFELGNVDVSLNLYFAWVKTWCNGCFDWVAIYYRVKVEDSDPGTSYSEYKLTWRNDFPDSGDDYHKNAYWDDTSNQLLNLSGLEAGDYEVEFYFQAHGKDGNDYFLSNNSGNYHANFTLRHKIKYHDDGKTGGSKPSDEWFSTATATVRDNTGLLRRSDGYVFAGWATSSGASTVEYEPGTSSMSVTLTADLDLYPVWKKGSYFISLTGSSTAGEKNTTDFIAGKSLTNNAVEVNGVTFSKSYYKTNADQTSIKQQYQNPNNFIVYDTKSKATTIRVYVKNTDTSSRNVYYLLAKEGSISESDQTVSLAAGEAKVINIDASNSKGTRVILCTNKKDYVFFSQIIAIESGETLPLPGETGYELAFPGRVANHFPNINGIEIAGQEADLKWNYGNVLKLRSGSSKYLKFTTTAATKLQVKIQSGKGFYVCTNKSNPSTTGFLTSGSTAGTKEIYLDAANTYYIMGENSSNDTKIEKVSFAAHSACTAPTGLAASSITYSGATFTVTDGTNANNYEFYVSTSSTAPTASTTPTYTSTSKTLAVDDLNKNTTYYAWVRTNGGYFHKSTWTALTGTSFKTLNAYDITYDCDGAESGCPATESGLALPNPLPTPVKYGYNFDGWFTNSGKTTPAVAGAAIAANTPLYAKWTKVYASGTYNFYNNATLGTLPNQKTITTEYADYNAFRIDNIFFSAINMAYEGGSTATGSDYKGWKIKKNNATIKFFVENDSEVTISVGSANTLNVSYTNTAGSSQTPTISSGNSATYTVKGGTMVTLTMSTGSTITIKQIAISSAASCTTNPTVTAGGNSAVTTTTATVSCASGISSLGSAGCSITSYGFVIGTSANPAIGGSGVTQHQVGTSYASTGTSFSKNLTGLTAGTTYYVRPYATNGNGTAYGAQTSFTTLPTTPTFSPASGSTVNGSQTITITGHSGSTVYYVWETSAQSASDIYNSGSGSHGTADAGTASVPVQSGKTLYAISRISDTNSAVGSASYTVDATAPSVSSATPASSATDVSISGNVTFTFSENVTIVDASKFAISPSAGVTWSTGSATVAGATVTIPYSGLSYSTVYTISAAAGAVKDAVNNTSTAWAGHSFTTEAEPVLYTVTYTYNGATGGSSTESSTQASEGASITLPTPTKTNYTFQGWYESGGTKAGNGGATYEPEADITLYALWRADCAGGGGGGGTLFSQNFNSATEVAYENRKDASLLINKNSSNNIVGTTAASQFTSIAAAKKDNTGIAINTTSGGNSVIASGFFQTYYDNTSGYWSVTKTTDFATTAPTAIKMSMDLYFDTKSSSGSCELVNFAIGDGFSDGLMSTSAQSSSNVHSGWGITQNSKKICGYNANGTILYNTALSESTWYSITWVINNTGEDLTYDDPDGSGTTTLANDKFDIWLKTQAQTATNYTKVVTAAATTTSKALQELYFGHISGKKNEFRIDNIVVADLTPSSGTCYYVTYNGNGATGGYTKDETAYALNADPTVASNSFTKTGYTFTGWNTLANGTGDPYAAGGTISDISADVTLYAQWAADAATYELTWNTNGGSDLVCSGTCTSGDLAYGATIVAPTDPTKSNYTFDGWKTNNDGTGSGKASTMPAANTTYYAAWKQTVTLKTGSQGSDGDKTPYIYWNGTALSDDAVHSAAGYTLNGYYTESTGGTKVLNADGTFASANVDGYITSSKWSRTGAAPTLYAQWRAAAGKTCYTWDASETHPQTGTTNYDGLYLTATTKAKKQANSALTDTIYDVSSSGKSLTGHINGAVIDSLIFGASTSSSDNTTFVVSFCSTQTFDTAKIIKVGGYHCTVYNVALNTAAASLTKIKAPAGTKSFVLSRNYMSDKLTSSASLSNSGSRYLYYVRACSASGGTHTISYNAGGGTGTMSSNTGITDDGSQILTTNSFTAPTNYSFAGWVADGAVTIGGDVKTAGTLIADGATITNITMDIALTAKWSQTVTLDDNNENHGATGDGSATAYYNAAALSSITHTTAASGYKLAGYYTAKTDGTKVLNSDGTYAGTAVTDWISDSKWTQDATSTPTLYAQYEAAGALIWNLGVNTDATSLTTSSKSSSFTEIAVANMGDATLSGSTYTKSAKSSLTGKISSPATKSDYVYVTFKVADGYKFTPSNISVKVQPVGENEHKAVELSLADATNTLASSSATKCDGTTSGKTTTVSLAGNSTFFTGNVTLKIYVYDYSGSATGTYRLGTPITIEGEIEETCATMPSYTSMSYTTTTFAPGADASGSPITIVGGDNINTYQWKYNTVNDRTSGTNCGTGTSLTPLTNEGAATDVTRYYWCEMTNTSCGITIKSPAVAITVAAAKSNATVTWTNPASTPNYGGGGYTIKATVDQTGWDGNAADLVITAPAGIRIYNVSSGTTSSQKWVQVNFDVQTSFDRSTYASNIPFSVSAAATATYNAISNDHNVSYSACTGGGGDATEYLMPVNADSVNSTVKGWRFAGTGKMWFGHGSSAPSTGSSNIKSLDNTMAGGVINKYYNTGGSYFSFYTEKAITGVRLYVYTSNSNVKVSNVYIANSQFATGTPSSGAVTYEVVYNDDNEGLDKGDNVYSAWAEITFASEVAAGKYGLIKLDNNVKIAGIGLLSGSSSGATLTTALTWSETVDDDSNKKNVLETAANFTITASQTGENNNSLGAITYSSNHSEYASVNATTGEVTITGAGTAQITATLAASGCYKEATKTYTIVVEEVTCDIAAGTLSADKTSKCESEDAVLTLTGFEPNATVTWYKGDDVVTHDGSTYTIETEGTTSTLTTDQTGTYSVMVNKGCNIRSNSVTISNKSTSVHATRLVKEWYIKNGRLTPDIALWELGDDCSFVSVAASDGWDAGTGLTGEGIFYEQDGIVYLKGTEPKTNAGAVQDYELTLTVNDGCREQTLDADGKKITIHHQQNTDKHVLAFVVRGKDKGGFTDSIPADQTTSVGLYNAIAANFDVLATNSRSTDDEQKLKEYYSQFDILCITDYPDTKKDKGVNGKSTVDALGALVDIRPILTMEAWVSGLANWKAKGISGSPKSPTTRQYTMDLQCKDHEIFAGTELTKVGEGDEAMYRVSMVDNTKEDYATLDATYGDGAHAEKEGYQYGKKPALQGFTFTQEMSDNDLLPIGLIDDGAGNPLQVGIERQHNMEARLMVLGINSYAMERLTDDGERVVINALNYLMKKNAEDIADCSTSFVGGAEGHEKDWDNADNWTGNTVPLPTQKVRILADCEVSSTVYALDVLIVTGGKYNHGSDDAAGKLTIKENGALIVGGKIQAASAPAYNRPRATTPEKLIINTNEYNQAALIFDNEEAETQATVKLYSLGRKPSSYQYQYFAVPMEVVPVNPTFANEAHGGTGIYTYVYEEATSGWTRRKYYDDLFAFEGLGITTKSTGAMNYTMTGTLASTATKEITLTHADKGLNLIGNSWMAPIQIGALAEDNTGLDNQTVYIYCAGRDADGGALSDVTETPGQWIAIPFSAASFATWKDAGKLSVIPAMQAFQIKVAAEATLTLDYDKVVRGSTNDLNAKLRAPGRRMAANEVTMTNIRVADSKTHTDLSLFEGDRFSEAFDNGWEAEYMNGDGRSAKLYAETEAGQMAVVAMYDYEGTVVGFAPGQETEYTFSFMGEDNGYYLNDIKLQNSVRISEGETYTFTYEEGDAANRFYISRTAINAPEVATGMENLDAAVPRVQKIIYNDKLYIIRGGRLYDATGKVVK